ncbi:MAG: hypothetical protein JWP52_833 [Rhizobacter sp.]|nr:hypothetical protein [Rhizobacter sp.]
MAEPLIDGFDSMQWGDPPGKLGPADALPLVERPGQPYEPCFRRSNESLRLGDVALSKVTYCFFNGGLSYVSLAADGDQAFAALQAQITQQHGAPRTSGAGYASWGSPDDADGGVGALFLTKKTPGALFMMTSNRAKAEKAAKAASFAGK